MQILVIDSIGRITAAKNKKLAFGEFIYYEQKKSSRTFPRYKVSPPCYQLAGQADIVMTVSYLLIVSVELYI